jgi:diguanylate cyclase
MAGEIETNLRGPQAYDLARRAVQVMERHQVWPTPLNFELWLHYAGDPESDLGREIQRIIDAGEPFTEAVADALAAEYLPKIKLNEQIRDAGDQLSRELDAVSKAVQAAQKSQASYGETLADAAKGLSGAEDTTALGEMVETLSGATRRVQRENKALERRLKDSTSEVTRLREHLEQVRRDATTDALTNLANRKAFDDELDRACAEADESGRPLALAVLDIDHFKGFNDTWGHQTGDQVIRYVASVIGRMGATPRFAARHGGEEFAVIFPGESTETVSAALEEIREEVASRTLKRRSTDEDLGAVTLSAGFAERLKGESAMSLMDRADKALYASKRSGRNRVSAALKDVAAA